MLLTPTGLVAETDDDRKKLPIAKELIDHLDTDTLMQIANKVKEDPSVIEMLKSFL